MRPEKAVNVNIVIAPARSGNGCGGSNGSRINVVPSTMPSALPGRRCVEAIGD